MLRKVLSEVKEMEIYVMYLGKPSSEVTWRGGGGADNVSTEQASLEGGVGKLQYNSMFVIIGCVWQYC